MEKHLYREMHEMEDSHWWFRAKRRIVLDLVKRHLSCEGTPRFLDLGCGTGSTLADLDGMGAVVGMDASEDAIRYASERTDATLIQGEVPESLSRIKDRFDCILMLDILEHLDDDLVALKATVPLLAPSGIMVVTVPAYQWLYAPRDTCHHHRRRYSRPQLRALMEGAGFSIELISYYNTLLFPLAAAQRIFSRMRKEEPGPDIRISPMLLNSLFERIFAFERHLLPHVSLPFGLSLISVSRAAGAIK